MISALALVGAALAAAASFSAPAQAQAVTHKCGKPVSSIVKTQETPFTTNSPSFETVPDSKTTVNLEKAGCIKVRFFAAVRCGTLPGPGECAVSASESGGAPLEPPIIEGVTLLEENGTGFATHSFAWVDEFDVGKHRIIVQVAVPEGDTDIELRAWTLEVEVTE